MEKYWSILFHRIGREKELTREKQTNDDDDDDDREILPVMIFWQKCITASAYMIICEAIVHQTVSRGIHRGRFYQANKAKIKRIVTRTIELSLLNNNPKHFTDEQYL